MIIILLLLCVVLADAFAKFLIKKHLSDNKKGYIYFGILTYILVGMLYYLMYQRGDNIGQIEAYSNVLSVVIMTGIGFFAFQERLNIWEILTICSFLLGGLFMYIGSKMEKKQ